LKQCSNINYLEILLSLNVSDINMKIYDTDKMQHNITWRAPMFWAVSSGP